MNKSQLVDILCKKTGLPKSKSNEVVTELTLQIAASLARGERCALPGLGSFTTKERPARKARNPRTGELVRVKAKKAAVFRPAQSVKDACNSKALAKALNKKAS